MTERFSNELAFSFLLDLQIAFQKEYSKIDEIGSFYSFQIDKKFKPILKDHVSHYNKTPKFNKSGKVFKDTESVKNVEYENIGRYIIKI